MKAEVKMRIRQIRRGKVPAGYKKVNSETVPMDWACKVLSDIVIFLDEERIPIKESERKSGKYPYYGASGIIDYVESYIFDGEYILLGEDGANIIDRSTPLAFRVSGKCWINNHAHVLAPKAGYDIDFLTNYLESLSYIKFNSGTAQPKLNQYTCRKIPVSCPPYCEQQKIAAILTAQDKIIELQENLLTEKQRQKKYLMQQLLTGKKRLPGFHKIWETVELGEIFDYIQPSAYLVKVADYKDTYRTPVLTAGRTFILGHTDETQGVFTKVPVVIFDDFTTATKYVDFPFKAKSSAMKILTIRDGFNIFFSYEAMQLIKFTVSGHERHWISKYRFLTIDIPDLQEQTAIAKVLSTADRELDLLRQSIKQEKQKKKALMQLLLTGIVRVKP